MAKMVPVNNFNAGGLKTSKTGMKTMRNGNGGVGNGEDEIKEDEIEGDERYDDDEEGRIDDGEKKDGEKQGGEKQDDEYVKVQIYGDGSTLSFLYLLAADQKMKAYPHFLFALVPLVLQFIMIDLLREITITSDLASNNTLTIGSDSLSIATQSKDSPKALFVIVASSIFVTDMCGFFFGASLKCFLCLINIDFHSSFDKLLAYPLYIGDLVVGIITLVLGLQFLTQSNNKIDLLLNVVALHFILDVDDYCCEIRERFNLMTIEDDTVKVPKKVVFMPPLSVLFTLTRITLDGITFYPWLPLSAALVAYGLSNGFSKTLVDFTLSWFFAAPCIFCCFMTCCSCLSEDYRHFISPSNMFEMQAQQLSDLAALADNPDGIGGIDSTKFIDDQNKRMEEKVQNRIEERRETRKSRNSSSGNQKPNERRKKPNERGKKPNQTGKKPNQRREKPNESGKKPNESGKKPNESGKKPNESGKKPNEREEKANEREEKLREMEEKLKEREENLKKKEKLKEREEKLKEREEKLKEWEEKLKEREENDQGM